MSMPDIEQTRPLLEGSGAEGEEDEEEGTKWEIINGNLSVVSVGQSGVWGVDSLGKTFYRTGTYGDEASQGTAWESIVDDKGDLKQISSGNNIVWGVTNNGGVNIRKGISQRSPKESRWQPVGSHFKLKQVNVSATSNQVWGVTSDNGVLWRAGITANKPEGTQWQKIEGKELEFVSVGRAGVWGVNSDGKIYHRSDTSDNNERPSKEEWVLVDSDDVKFKIISSGKSEVWGVDNEDQVYRRAGISAEAPEGTQWDRIEGIRLNQVCVSSRGNQVWGVDKDDKIYRLSGDPLNTSTMPGDVTGDMTDGDEATGTTDQGLLTRLKNLESSYKAQQTTHGAVQNTALITTNLTLLRQLIQEVEASMNPSAMLVTRIALLGVLVLVQIIIYILLGYQSNTLINRPHPPRLREGEKASLKAINKAAIWLSVVVFFIEVVLALLTDK